MFDKKELELARKSTKIGDTLMKSRDGYIVIDEYGIAVSDTGFVKNLSIIEKVLKEHGESVLGKRMNEDLLDYNDGIDSFSGEKVVRIVRDSQGFYHCPIDDAGLQAFYKYSNALVEYRTFLTKG